jgi:hypothetical protein
MDYKAKTYPELPAYAASLVEAYNAVPGSSGPYCNPDSLAAILDKLARDLSLVELAEVANTFRCKHSS